MDRIAYNGLQRALWVDRINQGEIAPYSEAFAPAEGPASALDAPPPQAYLQNQLKRQSEHTGHFSAVLRKFELDDSARLDPHLTLTFQQQAHDLEPGRDFFMMNAETSLPAQNVRLTFLSALTMLTHDQSGRWICIEADSKKSWRDEALRILDSGIAGLVILPERGQGARVEKNWPKTVPTIALMPRAALYLSVLQSKQRRERSLMPQVPPPGIFLRIQKA